MKYSVTDEQLDRLMKSYWDNKFSGAEVGVIENYVEDNDWLRYVQDNFEPIPVECIF